eukprot:TRINITY_DN30597_c0_g3_i1.p1 TRINITY_DN30597_c0_g3~~TRINITY_DN30597_c0_g3_i1.p1  ORF type:complete len:170 (-),score=29.34 TRINITY_DN30597_c0_g3_i1:471-980(-)
MGCGLRISRVVPSAVALLLSAWSIQASGIDEAGILGMNALTLATNDMALSFGFYRSLGLNRTFGGPSADFSTFGSSGGPAGGDNSFHINLFVAPAYKKPAAGAWNGWGRGIFYVSDVDGLYAHALKNGLHPEGSPRNASWGERYFQILDPIGHELSFAKPLEAQKQIMV